MAAKPGDKGVVSGVTVWTKMFLAVPWKLPATVKWQRRLVGCPIGEEQLLYCHIIVLLA